ncbi:MAG: hemolysin III family protein [Chitinophagales bacterium]|nr:hemolysin III family protein [Chitinophagales bacterium]MCZ2392793.1 hemolysin III family protein [Chitinophagales bacterium]
MRKLSKGHEIANTLTHLAGIILFISLLPSIFIKMFNDENIGYLWTVIVFSFGLMMVYGSSTLYHYVKRPHLKETLRIWDHTSIYLLIGGTYTPLVAKFLPYNQALWFLTIMWSIITLGVIIKLFFTGRFELFSVFSYLFLGWMAIFVFKDFIAVCPEHIQYLILFGGLSYTIGVLFYIWHKLPYNHAIWHVFVLAGSTFHLFAIQQSF